MSSAVVNYRCDSMRVCADTSALAEFCGGFYCVCAALFAGGGSSDCSKPVFACDEAKSKKSNWNIEAQTPLHGIARVEFAYNRARKKKKTIGTSNNDTTVTVTVTTALTSVRTSAAERASVCVCERESEVGELKHISNVFIWIYPASTYRDAKCCGEHSKRVSEWVCELVSLNSSSSSKLNVWGFHFLFRPIYMCRYRIPNSTYRHYTLWFRSTHWVKHQYGVVLHSNCVCFVPFLATYIVLRFYYFSFSAPYVLYSWSVYSFFDICVFGVIFSVVCLFFFLALLTVIYNICAQCLV